MSGPLRPQVQEIVDVVGVDRAAELLRTTRSTIADILDPHARLDGQLASMIFARLPAARAAAFIPRDGEPFGGGGS